MSSRLSTASLVLAAVHFAVNKLVLFVGRSWNCLAERRIPRFESQHSILVIAEAACNAKGALSLTFSKQRYPCYSFTLVYRACGPYTLCRLEYSSI